VMRIRSGLALRTGSDSALHFSLRTNRPPVSAFPGAFEAVGPTGEAGGARVRPGIAVLLDRREGGQGDHLVEVGDRLGENETDRAVSAGHSLVEGCLARRGLVTLRPRTQEGRAAIGGPRDGQGGQRIGRPAGDDVGGEGPRDPVLDVLAAQR
jgi:hypothetical protein